jgi:hypothetical protein
MRLSRHVDVEALIEQHRPEPGTEDQPASGGHLHHLNLHGLLLDAVARQADKDGRGGALASSERPVPVVVTRQTAWEVMADAQRRGVRI